MTTSKGNRIVPYVLELSPPPSPLLISSDEEQNDHKKRRNRKKAGWFSLTTCKCLSLFFGGLCLGAIIVVSITTPIMITLSKSTTKTSTIVSKVILTLTTITITTTTATTTTTTVTSTTTSTTTTTDVPCIPTCNSEQMCVQGACVGIGSLSCTLTWSRLGDGDIVMTTPNNSIISYQNKGPSSSTDQGQLDRDDKNGTGPENVFWSNNSTLPPTGTYYVCFSQWSFIPSASPTDPITATVKIRGPSNTTLIFTKTFTSFFQNYTTCGSTSGTLLGSFTYP